jgi:hypothetical protein
MKVSPILSATALLCLPFLVQAQSLLGGFMNGKGRGAVAISYTAEQYDEAFLVPEDADEVPIFNKMEVNSISLYASYGITARLDAVLNLPYIQAKGKATQPTLDELGYENERSGLQDLSVFLKYKLHSFEIGSSRLDFAVAAGVKTPLSSYRVNDGLQSIVAIGNQSTNFNGFGIAHFRTSLGLYVTGQGGYSYRTGEVPDAYLGDLRVGYGSKHFHVAAWYAKQISRGGVDILGEGFTGYFPATDVSYTRTGLNVYGSVVGGLGVSGGFSKYVSGRNVGKSTSYYGSLVFTF